MSGCSAVGALGLQASRRETTRQTNERRSPRDTTNPYQQAEKMIGLYLSATSQYYWKHKADQKAIRPLGVQLT